MPADPRQRLSMSRGIANLEFPPVGRPISFLHKDGLATSRIGFHSSEGVSRGVHAMILDERPMADVNMPLSEEGTRATSAS